MPSSSLCRRNSPASSPLFLYDFKRLPVPDGLSADISNQLTAIKQVVIQQYAPLTIYIFKLLSAKNRLHDAIKVCTAPCLQSLYGMVRYSSTYIAPLNS